MRVAMIGPFGFRPKKTMRARAFRLARALTAAGHAAALFMPPWHTPDEADRTWDEDGVHLRYVPLGGGPLGISRRLAREALAWRPDVIHCFKPKAYSGLAAWWLWQRRRGRRGRGGPRLIVDSDDWEGWGGWNDLDPYTPLQKRFFAWQEQWGMRHNDRLTVASRALETLAWGHGVARERVCYVPNGPGLTIAADRARRPDARPTVLLYTRFFEFAPARLVRVLAGVCEAVPDVRLLLVGASLHAADGAAFRHGMEAAGLWRQVDERGWLDEAALPDVLSQAHVALYLMDDTLLNRTKCPVKLADLVALGVPVVGERVGQVVEYVVHERTGLLYAPGDVDGVVDGAVRLLHDAALGTRFSQAARQHAAGFAWDRAAATMLRCYQP